MAVGRLVRRCDRGPKGGGDRVPMFGGAPDGDPLVRIVVVVPWPPQHDVAHGVGIAVLPVMVALEHAVCEAKP